MPSRKETIQTSFFSSSFVSKQKSNLIHRAQLNIYVNQYLAWLLCMTRPGHDLSWRAIRQRHLRSNERQNSLTSNSKYSSTPLLAHSSKSLLANVTSGDESAQNCTQQMLPNSIMNHIMARHPRCKNPNHNHDPNEVLHPRDMRIFRTEMRTIMADLKVLTDHVRKEEEEDDVSQDWKFTAMVLDRLWLIIFTLLTTFLSYVTLFSAPNFFKFR